MEDLHQFPWAGSSKDHNTHLERALSIIPFPYYWAWAIFGGVSSLISFTIMLFFERSYTFIWVFLVLSALTAWQSIGVVWAHKRMSLFRNTFIHLVEWPEGKIRTRYEEQIAIIFDDKKMIASGIFAVILAHLLGVDYFGFHFQAFPNIIFKIIYYSAVYTLGVGLYVMIMTASAVRKIGDLPLTANVLFSKEMQAIGILYSKFTIYSASIYIIWVLFQMLTPLQLSPLGRTLLSVFFAVLLCAYFILPQYSIHQMMVKTKQKKIKKFSSHLSALANETLKDPTDENLSSLSDFLDVERQLDKMNEWPFSFYEILHIVLITVIPLIVLTLEVVHGVINDPA
ncbi:MAG: hypothetical protein JW999_03095 [Methanotrichaceae archaeon]|nr:hypothetical protein [Methanotrichaceae archaeon]